MNPENSKEMRDEYELRRGGGVRGKYYERYIHGTSSKLDFIVGLPFVACSTSSAPSIGTITKPAPHPFNLGRLPVPVHAG